MMHSYYMTYISICPNQLATRWIIQIYSQWPFTAQPEKTLYFFTLIWIIWGKKFVYISLYLNCCPNHVFDVLMHFLLKLFYSLKSLIASQEFEVCFAVMKVCVLFHPFMIIDILSDVFSSLLPWNTTSLFKSLTGSDILWVKTGFLWPRVQSWLSHPSNSFIYIYLYIYISIYIYVACISLAAASSHLFTVLSPKQ